MNSDKILKEIKKYYSLESENFEILATTDCSIYWDQKKRSYIVEINRNQIDYYLIHEFGHLFLSKITQYPYFIKFTSETEKVNQKIIDFFNKNPMMDIEDLPKDLREFRIIHDYSNGILDCFVNYNTFIKKKNYYNFYIDYINEILNSGRKGIRSGPLRILLPSYINFYLEFKHNFLTKDRIQNQNIESFLLDLKNVIVNSTKFKLAQFNSLNKLMDNYTKIKDSTDFKIIINFMQKTFLKLSLWSEKTLKEKFGIIYPI